MAAISFLNTRPLIHGLDEAGDLDLVYEVPAGLAAGLGEGRFDVALLPVIDYQRLDDLVIVPAGGIACDGPTLTVRLFSDRPIEQITTLACDTDSHTSVALARIILAERYGIRPRFVDLDRTHPARPDAMLLIGDKVVCEEPAGLEHQLDLGQAWKELTGLPFVFAVWTARAGVDLGDLPQRLEHAKRQGLSHLSEIIARHAVPRGWPAGVALQYLTIYLNFDITPRHMEAIRRFHDLAHKHGVLTEPPKPLRVYG